MLKKAHSGVSQLLQSGWIELLQKSRAFIRRVLLIGLPIFVVYNVYFPWPSLKERSLFVILILAIVFLSRNERRGSAFWLVFDSVNLLITLVVFGYTFWYWEPILINAGIPSTTNLVLGTLGVYVTLVATWKVVDKPLLAVVFLFIIYTFFGQYLPQNLGGHSGYSVTRIFTFMFSGENGLMGYVLGVTLKYVLLFLLLGQVLRGCGALDFIFNLAQVFFHRGARGPALMTVFSSCMMGTMTGSGTADVFVIGNVTIPMMKQAGVKPEFAAAIAATSSIGAQIMPPVMGFAAFLMTSILGVAYIEVVRAAFIPAVLYYLAVSAAVFARTPQMQQASDQTATGSVLRLKDVVFRISTISFLGTLGILVTLLVVRYSLQLAALYAMAFGFVSSFLGRDRFTVRKVVEALEGCGRDATGISVASLVMGLIIGAVLLTGLGARIPDLFLNWSGGNLSLLLLFTMFACLILGIGLPTSAAYLIVAVTVSVAMTKLGVPILHAHMFVFYSAIVAMITPPVALTAYAAASIAGSRYWRTGVLAFVLVAPALLVPFAFILRPALMMSGSILEIVGVTLLSATGVVCIAMALVGKMESGFGPLIRIALGVGGVFLLLFPVGVYSLVGVLLCLAGWWKVYFPRVAKIFGIGKVNA